MQLSWIKDMDIQLSDLQKYAGLREYFKENYQDRVAEMNHANTIRRNQNGKRSTTLGDIDPSKVMSSEKIKANTDNMKRPGGSVPQVKDHQFRNGLLTGVGVAAAVGAGKYMSQRKKRNDETQGYQSVQQSQRRPNIITSYEPTAELSIEKGLAEYNRRMAEREKMAARAPLSKPNRAEIIEMRRFQSRLKDKVKKEKAMKQKSNQHRLKKTPQRKKFASLNNGDLEKVASLMADQFIAATSLQNVDPYDMDFEQEVIAGYKSFIDEVSGCSVE